MSKQDTYDAVKAHRARSEQLRAEKREADCRPEPTRTTRERSDGPPPRSVARRPLFRRDYCWVAVRPIILGTDSTLKPGELVPKGWSSQRLRRLHRSQQIGPLGSEWTEIQIRQWEDQVLARALKRVEDPEERARLEIEWDQELQERRASREENLDWSLEERRISEQRAAEHRANRARARREKAESDRREAERVAEAEAAERAAEIERIHAEELEIDAQERQAAADPEGEQEG